MQCKILLGSPQAQKEYISSLIAELSVPSYSITTVEGTVKIEDVHQIVRASRLHVGKDEKRIIIFGGSLTIPAQNALLKYIEELPESDYVLFSVTSADSLLETIRSRCHSIFLGTHESEENALYTNHLDSLLSEYDIRTGVLTIAQKVTSSHEYAQFIRELRNVIVKKIISGDTGLAPSHVGLLRYLHQQNQYVQENNVNPKFTIESFVYGYNQTQM